MIFICWLLLHALGGFIHWLLVGHDPRCAWRNLPRNERLIVVLWFTIPLSWFCERTDPSPGEFTAGFALLAVGLVLIIAAKWSNPYWSPIIEKPERVVRTGAYRWLRHPSYCGSLMQSLGTVLVLGHGWGFVPLSLYAAVLWWRARREDRLLGKNNSMTGG